METSMFRFDSASEAETATLGGVFAAALEPGTCVALLGNLGAGKTRLAQAIAAGLGVDRREVASPTFVLIHEYAGRIPLYHFDAYRLRDEDEFIDLGAAELLRGDGVCLIEWADRVADALPRDRVTVEIEATGETGRRFKFRSSGERSRRVVEKLANAMGDGR